MNTFDLQVHSTASDGVLSPTEVVSKANTDGVSVIALTDHDTVEGIEEALSAGRNAGIEVIPGIELSVEEFGIHILGYGINWQDAGLLKQLAGMNAERIVGAKKMVENLRGAGFVVEWDDVLRVTTGSMVGRPHIARAILRRPENREKLGSIVTVHDFIQTHLTDESPHYVHRSHIASEDAIALLHRAGSVAVWSHPGLLRGGCDAVEKFLPEMAAWGIDGLEVFHAAHTEEAARCIQRLVVTRNLLATAGSDFHAAPGAPLIVSVDSAEAEAIGDYPTYGFATADILPRLRAAMVDWRTRSENPYGPVVPR